MNFQFLVKNSKIFFLQLFQFQERANLQKFSEENCSQLEKLADERKKSLMTFGSYLNIELTRCRSFLTQEDLSAQVDKTFVFIVDCCIENKSNKINACIIL